MENILNYKIGELLTKSLGSTINYTIEGEVELDGLKFTSDLFARIELMRIEKAINVSVRDLGTQIEIQCDKCTSKYKQDIDIDFVERQFYFKVPKDEDTRDIYVADMKKTEVDISEMLRQEINLHFPPIAVCSKHCKGLCPVCGVNKNITKCDCKPITPENTKVSPFAQLKDLLK